MRAVFKIKLEEDIEDNKHNNIFKLQQFEYQLKHEKMSLEVLHRFEQFTSNLKES